MTSSRFYRSDERCRLIGVVQRSASAPTDICDVASLATLPSPTGLLRISAGANLGPFPLSGREQH